METNGQLENVYPPFHSLRERLGTTQCLRIETGVIEKKKKKTAPSQFSEETLQLFFR